MPLRNLSLRAAAALSVASLSLAQTPHVEEGRLGLPQNPGFTSQWGYGVAISNQRVAVGDATISTHGRVATFLRSAGLWTAEAEIVSLDGDANDGFGASIALEGDTMVVGAPWADPGPNGPGAAYVFTRSGNVWTQVQKFSPPVPKSQGLFGETVALSGNTLAIGAPQTDTFSAGEVYVYVKSGGTWIFQQKLAPSAMLGARAGRGLALEGDRIVIGAPHETQNGLGSVGRVYVFERVAATWSQVAAIDSPMPVAAGTFGSSVDVEADRIVVGATGEPATNGVWGRAHVFVKSGANWTLEQTLVGSNTDTQACAFGSSIDLDGSRIAVGAPGYSHGVPAHAGVVKIFEKQGSAWIERPDVTSSGAKFNARLGDSVALEGNWLVGGAPSEPSPYLSGAGVVFDLTPPQVSVYCTAKVSSSGCTPAIGWSGTPSASSAAPFLVTAVQIVGKKNGLLLYGSLYNNSPFQGGTLCIATPFKRTLGQNSAGNSPTDCSGTFAFDFNAYAQTGADPTLVAGKWVWSQYWYRDPLALSGTGLSDALRFRFGN